MKLETNKVLYFDLYGTLLSLDNPQIIKILTKYRKRQIVSGVPTIDARKPTLNIREKLLTLDLVKEYIPSDILDAFSDKEGSTTSSLNLRAAQNFEDAMNLEVASVHPIQGAIKVLKFFKRRGHEIGLVSNVSSFHKKPYYDFLLDKLISNPIFSCDVGIAKPDSKIFEIALNNFNASPDNSVYIGDSFKLDVLGPEKIGIQAIHVSKSKRHFRNVDDIYSIGLFNFNEEKISDLRKHILQYLLDKTGHVFDQFEHPNVYVGKYNLVYRCTSETTDDVFFVKRYLHNNASAIDQLGHLISKITGLHDNKSEELNCKGEKLLIMPEILGGILDENTQLSIEMMKLIGKNLAFTYIFSNTDMRPMNAKFQQEPQETNLSIFDFEHCFFDSILTDDGRISRSVLYDASIIKLVRRFFRYKSLSETQYDALVEGMRIYYRELGGHWDNVKEMVRETLIDKTELKIGTEKYRRMFLQSDLDRMVKRFEQGPLYIIEMVSKFRT